MRRLDHYWQTRNPFAWSLLPLSGLFCAVAVLRRAAYRRGLLARQRLPVPVIVVGNISVGGTGKTPLVIWLANQLKARGHRPGILTRGYRGTAREWPQLVGPDSDPARVGDEAVLLARHGGCPVAAGPDRGTGGRMLVERHGCDLLVCDDGLQHYALDRDLEIAVIDGERRLGNGFCLPAGPLREPPSRLDRVDLVVVNGANGAFTMKLEPGAAVNLGRPGEVRPLAQFRGREILAVAGIGNPGRFFRLLRSHGIRIRERAFPDHHPFRPEDFTGAEGASVLMTEKDAVKCEPFAAADFWYLPVQAVPDTAFETRFNRLLTGLLNG